MLIIRKNDFKTLELDETGNKKEPFVLIASFVNHSLSLTSTELEDIAMKLLIEAKRQQAIENINQGA